MHLLLVVVLALVAAASPAAAVCDIGLAFPDESAAALDADGNGAWGFPGDRIASVAIYAGPGELFLGDWNGDGFDDLAKLVFVPDGSGFGPDRPYFYVDANGSGTWEGTAGGDAWANWIGAVGSGDPTTILPFAWRAFDHQDRIAFYAPEIQRFAIDLNGNTIWNGSAGGDRAFRFAAFTASAGSGYPVVGDWDGDGDDDAGYAIGTRFYLDRNGNGTWEGNGGGDRNTSFAASYAGRPIVGDWDGDGDDEIGVFVAPGTFLLDANDNGVWDGRAGGDVNVGFGGMDILSQPLVCDWNGDGADDVGLATSQRVFRIDFDGDRVYGPGDRSLAFTPSGQGPATPIAGTWAPAP